MPERRNSITDRTRWEDMERIPAGPFVAWLERRIKAFDADKSNRMRGHIDIPSARLLADELGITPRTLYRYRRQLDGCGRPSTQFIRQQVERMLDRVGVDLGDIYPEFAADVGLEPDAYCSKCREVVTPIKGLCPWCDSRTASKRVAA